MLFEILLFLFSPPTPQLIPTETAQRQVDIVVQKPVIVMDVDIRKYDVHYLRVQEVKKFYRKYNAPLEAHADCIVKAAEDNGIDYRFLPAISIKESTGGKALFRPYNAWGWGKSGFSSFCEGANVIARGLKKNYNLNDLKAFARKYCPDTADTYAVSLGKLINSMTPLTDIK